MASTCREALLPNIRFRRPRFPLQPSRIAPVSRPERPHRRSPDFPPGYARLALDPPQSAAKAPASTLSEKAGRIFEGVMVTDLMVPPVNGFVGSTAS
jgi:hypothetical protein